MSVADPFTQSGTGPRLATREFVGRDADAHDEVGVRVRDITHSFGEGEARKAVLVDNNLKIARGELVIMTGPSGSGKTTLLTLIGGLRSIQQGSIEIAGRRLDGLTSEQLVEMRRNIGFIFQAHNLFASLTAFQNVRMALELRGGEEAEMNAKAEEMLTRLGLGHRLHHKPGQLSGGQRQRVAIARALVNRPALILADEPTAALDKESARQAVDLLKEMTQKEKITILLVTHDNRILDVADRIVNMVDGRVKSNVVVGAAVDVINFLRNCPLFRELLPGTLAGVADKVQIEDVKAGTVIIRQGDPGDKFYIIVKGTAEVHQTSGETTRMVAELKSGDFFGEAALLEDKPRNATVTAKTDMQLYVLNKDDFNDTMRASDSFADQIRKALFERS